MKTIQRNALWPVLTVLLCMSASTAGEVALEVPVSRVPLHVSLPLPEDIALAPGCYALAPDVLAQVVEVESTGKPRYLSVVLPPAPDENPRRLILKHTTSPQPRFVMKEITDKSLELSEGEHRVFTYNHGVISREGVAPRYNRSDYFHPLYGLQGEVLTDDFPKDHYHHRGLFWAWTTVLVGPDNRKFESWIPNNFNYVFERWLCRQTGNAAAVLSAEVSWQAGDHKVVREEWLATVYPQTNTGRFIDFQIIWTALQDSVTVKGEPRKGYGGFSIRFAPRKDTIVTTPDGQGSKDLEAGKIAWADLSATFEGAKEPSGVGIFVHPQHPGAPLTWLTRHYGFLCPEYPGLGDMTLLPGKPVRVAYRVWIHNGVPTVESVKAQDEAYRQSLAVKVVSE